MIGSFIGKPIGAADISAALAEGEFVAALLAQEADVAGIITNQVTLGHITLEAQTAIIEGDVSVKVVTTDGAVVAQSAVITETLSVIVDVTDGALIAGVAIVDSAIQVVNRKVLSWGVRTRTDRERDD